MLTTKIEVSEPTTIKYKGNHRWSTFVFKDGGPFGKNSLHPEIDFIPRLTKNYPSEYDLPPLASTPAECRQYAGQRWFLYNETNDDEWVDTCVNIEYIELKDSINSSPAVVSDEDLARIDIWKTNPKLMMRRPKEPVLRSLSFATIKKPVLKLLSLSQLGPIKHPKLSELKYGRWLNNQLPRIEANRAKYVNRVNDLRRRHYDARLRKYNEEILRRKRKLELHQATNLRRLRKFETRLKRWENLVARSKASVIKRSKPRYNKDNPHTLMRLTRVGSTAVVSPLVVGWGYISVGLEDVDPLSQARTYLEWMEAPLVIRDPGVLSEVSDQVALSFRHMIRSAIPRAVEEVEPLIVRKIYDKLANQKLHIGNILAERAQTLDLLVTTWRRVALLVQAKKGLLKQVWKTVTQPKQVANEILAFQFGVKPLANDIMALADSIANGMGDYQLVTRSNTKRDVSFETEQFSFVGSVTVSYVLRYQVGNTVLRPLNQLGLVDPAQILWEVTPWSFVVDWLIPIGAWLQALTTTCGLDFERGTKTVTLIGTWTFRSGMAAYPSFENFKEGLHYGGQGGVYKGTYKERTILTDFPTPESILNVKSPFSWSHGISSLALLIQKLR